MINPSFLEVDRILARQTIDGEEKYLVKWNALNYTESTWELPTVIKVNIHPHLYRASMVNKGLLGLPNVSKGQTHTPTPTPTSYTNLSLSLSVYFHNKQ